MEVGENNVAWLGHQAWGCGKRSEIPGWRDQQGPYLQILRASLSKGHLGSQ